jgi:hypothetical protein
VITAALLSDLYGTELFQQRADAVQQVSTRPVWRVMDFDNAVRTLPGPSAQEQREIKARAVLELFQQYVEQQPEYRDELVDEILADPKLMNAYGEYMEALNVARQQAAEAAPPAREGEPARSTSTIYPAVLLDDRAIHRQIKEFEELQNQVRLAKSKYDHVQKVTVYTPRDEQLRDPLWFVYDPGIPPELADAILGVREMDVAYTLMMMATELGRWNVDAVRRLFERMVRSYRRFARFIAGLPGASVPLLQGDKLDYEGVLRRHGVLRTQVDGQAERALAELDRKPTP